MTDIRRWAHKFDDKYGGFYQYLLGNHTFEDCAIEVIDDLHDTTRDNVQRVIKTLVEVIRDLEGNSDATDKLEQCIDSLGGHFNLPVWTPKEIKKLEADPPVATPILAPKASAPPVPQVATETEGCDLSDLLGL
jgi:hypothetical protein